MKTRLICLSFLFATAYSLSAMAQITYDACTDLRGQPVSSIADPSLKEVANASLATNGAPLIRYNPNIVTWLSQKTRLFFHAHECGHHARGHNFDTVPSLAAEQDADCFAIQALVNGNLVNDNDVTIIQNDLNRANIADWSHLPGLQRTINLRRCLAIVKNPPRPPAGMLLYRRKQMVPSGWQSRCFRFAVRLPWFRGIWDCLPMNLPHRAWKGKRHPQRGMRQKYK